MTKRFIRLFFVHEINEKTTEGGTGHVENSGFLRYEQV